MEYYRKHYIGRPSPLYFAPRLTEHFGGAEDLSEARRAQPHRLAQDQQLHGPDPARQAHGQAADHRRDRRRPAWRRTATVCALFNLPCTVYMGEVDIARQQPNVFRMKLLGAEVVPVKSGTRTLQDAMNEALRDWVANVENTFYIIGTVAGPHPYPTLVRDFQSMHRQRGALSRCRKPRGRLPDQLGRRASAAAPTPWACSIRSSTTAASASTASKRAATASRPDVTRVADRRPPRRAARQPHLSAAR
jgi:tryptophan synthase beta chain